MNIKDLQKIIDILQESDVSEFELEQDGTSIKITRGSVAQPVVQAVPVHGQSVQQVHAAIPQTAVAVVPVTEVPAEEDDNSVRVESPIVGTFYRKPSPDADYFVQVGSTVKKGQTLCIIEAMKLMNEIESPADGIIKKILVDDTQVVEFGEVLFHIQTA